MLLNEEIKLGEIYGYDVDCQIHSLHVGTYKVKLLSHNNGLGTVESVETKELFHCGLGHLTTIDRCKEMYKTKNKVFKNEEYDCFQEFNLTNTLNRLKNILEIEEDLNEKKVRQVVDLTEKEGENENDVTN